MTQLLQTQKIRGDRGMDQYIGNVSMKVSCLRLSVILEARLELTLQVHAKLGGVTHHVPQPMVSCAFS